MPLYQLLIYGACGRLRYIVSVMGSWSPQLRDCGHLCYVGPLSPQLVASATWDLCRFSWSSPLRETFVASVGRETFVASVGRLCYVGPLSPQLVTLAMWDLCCLS